MIDITRICAYPGLRKEKFASMAAASPVAKPVLCNCLALRQAARHVTRLYDGALAPFGLRTTQFSVLVRLQRSGPWSIHALAEALVMDRTTLGRTIRPLARDKLLCIGTDPADRRGRALSITDRGAALLARAMPAWQDAQARLEQCFGAGRAAELRTILAELSACSL